MRTGIWVIGIAFVALGCGKSDKPAAGVDKGPTVAAEAKLEPSEARAPEKPPLSERLEELQARAAAASSPAEIESFLAEGNVLRQEAESSGDQDLQLKALEVMGPLVTKKNFLGCGEKETPELVASCLDGLYQFALLSSWPGYLPLCQEAVRTDMSVATTMVSGEPACTASVPSYLALLEAVHASAAVLKGVDKQKWLGQQQKAVAEAWKKFGETDEVKTYWGAVGEVLQAKCASVEDGELDVGAVIEVADFIEALGGAAAVGRLPSTSYKKLLKETESEKGKVLEVKAKVLSISKDGEYYRGQLIDSHYSSYMFVTKGDTEDIYEDSRVKLRGVVTQIQHFETRSGGNSIAPVVVGYLEK